ncbi:MAG: hypothetical protein ACYTAF_05340 [Planctomycetota bacterium]|jgi:hypothetical protein
MRRSILAAVLLSLLAGPALTQDAPKPPGSQQPPDPIEKPLWEKIDKAIDKGVDWLKKRQLADGSFGETKAGDTYGEGEIHHHRYGLAALSMLALLKSDVPAKDPVIQKGMEYVFQQTKEEVYMNYERAAALMMMEAYCEAKQAEKEKGHKTKKKKRKEGDFKEPKYRLGGTALEVAQILVTDILKSQSAGGGWRYGSDKLGTAPGSAEDISATQFVLLGLKSALRMRIGVPTVVFKKAADYILTVQQKDGPKVKVPRQETYKPGDRSTYEVGENDRVRGWPYIKSSPNAHEMIVSGSMTTAGIGGLLICKSVIGKSIAKSKSEKMDQAIWDGFAWLAEHWEVVGNPGREKARHYYYLYGLERVGVLGMYEKIGGHWWYKEGAELLVAAQKDDGHWDTDMEIQPTDLIDTCLALMFLKRGTVPIGDVMTKRAAKHKEEKNKK